MVRVLVVATWMDAITSTSAEAALRFAEWARKEGHEVDTLLGWQALRGPLLFELLAREPQFVSFWGHGSDDTIWGNDLLLGLVTPFNAGWLSKRMSHSMACLTGKVLADDIIEEGGYGYYGAKDVLFGAFNEEYGYYDDWVDYMTYLPKLVLQDERFGAALTRFKAKAEGYADLYTKEKPDGSWDWYAASALHNSRVYALYGNPELRLSEVVKMSQERRFASSLEALRFMFDVETIKAQLDPFLRSMFTFGVVGGVVATVVAPPVIDYLAERAGAPKPSAEIAKEIAKIAGAVSPY